jgi:hypothetical protein
MAALLHRGSAGFIPSSKGGEFSTGYMGIFAPALTFEISETELSKALGGIPEF